MVNFYIKILNAVMLLLKHNKLSARRADFPIGKSGLKDQSGYTLIETMVSLGLLGILIVLSAIAYTRFFDNPKILLRNEALYLANQEITNTINKKIFTDTAYTNENMNLAVERKIYDMQTFNKIEVTVVFIQTKKELIKLSSDIKK